MSERAPYSRVYWSIRDDEKFDTIRGSDQHLATWLRLLLAADMAYPASADLPATVRKSSVTALVTAELIDLVPGGMFRLRGLTAERERRKAAATSRGPNGTRTVTERSANGDLDETRQDKTSITRASAPTNGHRPKPNSVDRDPSLREMREAQVERYGKGMDEPTPAGWKRIP